MKIDIEKLMEDEDFKAAEPEELGIWLKLATYCDAAGYTDWIIPGLTHWTERKMLAALGIYSHEINENSELFGFDDGGVDLCVRHPGPALIERAAR